jgi:hypothetical protein
LLKPQEARRDNRIRHSKSQQGGKKRKTENLLTYHTKNSMPFRNDEKIKTFYDK